MAEDLGNFMIPLGISRIDVNLIVYSNFPGT